MGYLESILLVAHIVVALVICGLVLLQHGKGADMGAAFGSGSSGSVFGSAGSANFLSRSTAVLAAVFFLSSIGLTWYGATRTRPGGLMDKAAIEKTVPAPKASDIPVAPGAPVTGTLPATPVAPAVPAAPVVPKTDTAPASKSADVPK
jgi:preprotein translocase subunit SecG